jgi:ABC-type multidrug transport system ATPase subunit
MMEKLEPCEGEVRTDKGIRVSQYHQHFEELLPLEKTGVEYLRDDFNLDEFKSRATLGQFGLPGSTHFTKIGNLSGGQKARVAFAALMLTKPHIIILDEPTNHLDIESVEALTDAVKQFNGGLVIVTHDARLIQAIDSELWVVEDNTCYRFEKYGNAWGFDGYRDKVLDQLEKRQEEVERMEQKRRAEREKKRLQIVGEQNLKAAKERKDKEEAMAKEADAKKPVAAKAEAGKKASEDKKPTIEEAEDDEEDEGESEEVEAPAKTVTKAAGADAKHPEFKVAEVSGIKAIKKKKGFFIVELDVGQDDNIKVVTNLKNVIAGSKVIVALEGSKVLGEEVEETEIHGETSQGVLCGPKEMGWSGEASEVITLKDKCEPGSAAPSDEKSPLIENDEDEDDDEEDSEEKDEPPPKTESKEKPVAQTEEENQKKEAEADKKKQKAEEEKQKKEAEADAKKQKAEEEKRKKQEEGESEEGGRGR